MKIETEELKALIPSEDVRKHIVETNYEFNDWQKAALFYHRELPLEEQYLWLGSLKDKTEDVKLKNQISDYLEREEKVLRLFRDNSDRNCIYILNYYNEYDEKEIIYFFDYKVACDCGKKLKVPFWVVKHKPCSEITPELSEGNEYNGESVAFMYFNKFGAPYRFDSYELPETDSGKEWDEDFRNICYEVPYPFERGDIVKIISSDVTDGNIGIVETSNEEFYLSEERQRKLSEKGSFYDYSDVQVRVIFPDDDGQFSHSHINPVFLERYEAKVNTEKTVAGVLDNFLIEVSNLYKGKSALDSLYYWGTEYRKIKRRCSE